MIPVVRFFVCLLLLSLPLTVFAQTEVTLINGDMSGEFAAQGNYKAVPNGWTFFVTSGAADSDRYTWPPHALSKPISWKIAGQESAFLAGGYQQVAAAVGTGYTFAGNVFLWTCDDAATNCIREGARYSTPESGAQARVGIDPAGGTDPSAESVVWGEWVTSFDQYAALSVEATAEGDQITVFVQVDSGTAMLYNEAYWDDLSLSAGEIAATVEATPEATAEAVEPTATSDSSLISPPLIAPVATLSVQATSTPAPTEISTVLDTASVICATFFEDANQNGRYDEDETALPGASLQVGEDTLPIEELNQCSEALTPGVIAVVARAPEGYGLTTPAEYQVQVSMGRQIALMFGAAEGFTPPATPAPVIETLTPPEALTRRPVRAAEEPAPFERAFDYSGYIVLALAATVLLGGSGLLFLLRTLR